MLTSLTPRRTFLSFANLNKKLNPSCQSNSAPCTNFFWCLLPTLAHKKSMFEFLNSFWEQLAYIHVRKEEGGREEERRKRRKRGALPAEVNPVTHWRPWAAGVSAGPVRERERGGKRPSGNRGQQLVFTSSVKREKEETLGGGCSALTHVVPPPHI